MLSKSLRPSQRNRHVGFLALSIVSLIMFRASLVDLVKLSLHDERYSYLILAPFVSAFLIWLNRERIFVESHSGLALGIPILAVGIAIGLTAGRGMFPGLNLTLPISILGFVLVLTGAFGVLYGRESLVTALFPFLLLLIAVPLPASTMERVVVALQKGSANMSYGLFKLVGVPVLRDGFRFSLPGVQIEVAEECSGLRSSLSLLIVSILAARLMLRSGWAQLWFILLTIPVVIFKNAVRIVTISWLGVYVDKGFFFGNLHRHGGLPFSFLAIGIMYAVMQLLRKTISGPRLLRSRRTATAQSLHRPFNDSPHGTPSS